MCHILDIGLRNSQPPRPDDKVLTHCLPICFALWIAPDFHPLDARAIEIEAENNLA